MPGQGLHSLHRPVVSGGVRGGMVAVVLDGCGVGGGGAGHE